MHLIFIYSNCSIAENRVSFNCHLKRGGLDFQKEDTFELVQFVGYFRKFGVWYGSRITVKVAV